jgi:hypothetical protein
MHAIPSVRHKVFMCPPGRIAAQNGGDFWLDLRRPSGPPDCIRSKIASRDISLRSPETVT